MSIQIIIDSCCDVTPALRRAMRFEVASLTVRVGEQSFRDDETLSVSALLQAMKACKDSATSACPSPEEYASLMRRADQSVVVTLSSKLSGSYNAAMVARDMVLEEFPEKRIHVFDSESASAGELRVALLLRQYIDGGMEFDEIVEKTTQFIAGMKTFFVLEDLSNLVKNGRISKVAGLMGTMLSIRPIMGENGHGEIIQLDKVRGTQTAMRRLVEIVAAHTSQFPQNTLTLVLSYCNCPQRAAELKEKLLAASAALREIILVPTCGISTLYANDGGVVLAV